jgi:hypothetical protein
MRRLLVPVLLLFATPAQADVLMAVRGHSAILCKYLLAAKAVRVLVVQQNWDELKKIPDCIVAPPGTVVGAFDSDGGDFLGVTIQSGQPGGGSQVWTYGGWLMEIK